MEEQYSINEILNAINDLSDIKKEKIVSNSSAQNSLKKSDIPSNTLKYFIRRYNTLYDLIMPYNTI